MFSLNIKRFFVDNFIEVKELNNKKKLKLCYFYLIEGGSGVEFMFD